MDKKQEQKEKMSRRSFLQVAGSVAAGGFIMAGAGSLVYKMFADPEGLAGRQRRKALLFPLTRRYHNGRFPRRYHLLSSCQMVLLWHPPRVSVFTT